MTFHSSIPLFSASEIVSGFGNNTPPCQFWTSFAMAWPAFASKFASEVAHNSKISKKFWKRKNF